jgi:hypothetical protein
VEERMIAVRLEGRLGNQLFQYAFAYATAKRLNTSFYLDKSADPLLIDKYFNIEKDFCWILDTYVFSIKGFKNLFSFHLKRNFYLLIEKLLGLSQIIFDSAVEPAMQTGNIKNHSIYQGFFQSEQYFSEFKKEVFDLFSIKSEYKNQFEETFRSLPAAGQYVTVHIRRGDYIDHGIVLDTSYYHNAIKSIHNRNNYYIFISDDPGFVRKEFSYLSNSHVSEYGEIIDLQFLINADICILSNSSFSWWGAWLNVGPAKIIAPKYWLGNEKREFPVDVIPHNWIKF